MMAKTPTSSLTSSAADGTTFSLLARAVLDGFNEGLIVFDVEGGLVYANHAARRALADASIDLHPRPAELQARLAMMGGRMRPLRLGESEVGVAVFLPAAASGGQRETLADREKETILRTLDAHHWKLMETAKHLGISRTTLWRRLKAYGLHRDGRSKWT